MLFSARASCSVGLKNFCGKNLVGKTLCFPTLHFLFSDYHHFFSSKTQWFTNEISTFASETFEMFFFLEHNLCFCAIWASQFRQNESQKTWAQAKLWVLAMAPLRVGDGQGPAC